MTSDCGLESALTLYFESWGELCDGWHCGPLPASHSIFSTLTARGSSESKDCLLLRVQGFSCSCRPVFAFSHHLSTYRNVLHLYIPFSSFFLLDFADYSGHKLILEGLMQCGKVGYVVKNPYFTLFLEIMDVRFQNLKASFCDGMGCIRASVKHHWCKICSRQCLFWDIPAYSSKICQDM